MAFVPNRNFPKQIERTTEYVDGLAESAEIGAQRAREHAPVKTGAYRDSIGVVTQGPDVYISAKDFKAAWIEYGTSDTPVFAPLRKGAQDAGLKFRASK